MNKRTGIIRILTSLMGCVLVFGLAFGLAGCGKASEEEMIRSEVTKFLDVFKDPSAEKLEEYLGSDDDLDLSQLEEYGIDINEFLVHSFGHFDYAINSVNVDGDKATVALSLTNANMQSALENASNALSENSDQYADLLTADDAVKQLMKLYFEEYYKQMDASEDLVTTDVDLKLTKGDDGWEIDQDGIEAVYSAMYGGVEF